MRRYAARPPVRQNRYDSRSQARPSAGPGGLRTARAYNSTFSSRRDDRAGFLRLIGRGEIAATWSRTVSHVATRAGGRSISNWAARPNPHESQPAEVSRERVLVLDFGSQYAQLIARRVREQHVFCEIVRHDITRRADPAARPQGPDPLRRTVERL